ncbi:c-type cytochrome [Flavobacterium sp.]|jgi:cytochrome c|uniref:c-type cytochrome n=1 Tax=Flavobacterium sp. TaxID=239 RepID=UPI0037BFD1C2
MKNFIKSLLFTILFVFAASCGGKNDEQDFGKKETIETKEQDEDAFPLAEKGKEIFEGKGTCATCHKSDVKLVGPSIQDIAKIYEEKNANIVTFLKGEGEPIVDPTQYEVMKANFALTKTFSDEELQSLEQYIQSEGE